MHDDESPPLPADRGLSLEERVGLCTRCRHARRIVSSRGVDFWQCRRSAEDPSYPRYPRLPVLACNGFDPYEARTPPSQGEAGG
jgi:hypothetical protein